jgi:hypothetical protein
VYVGKDKLVQLVTKMVGRKKKGTTESTEYEGKGEDRENKVTRYRI